MRYLDLSFKGRKILAVIILIAFFAFTPTNLVQAESFMPVADVKPGMKGIAKTVIEGTKIEEFNVEVISVMKNKGPSGDLILVRASGEVIDKAGGIAQGMSGSPVYIDGKLVGAVAYGWSLTDHRIGMLTPIHDMLKLWQLPDKNFKAKTSEVEESKVIDETSKELVPITTPIMANGFSERAMDMLKTKLQPYNMVPYAVGAAPDDMQNDKLQPGSAVGAQLVSGDVSIGAVGTVTYVEGDKVLAFGHPFLKKGNTNYFLTDAYIFTTISSIENSFKLGTTGQNIGIVNQDRGAGIAGLTGKYPTTVPIRMTIVDKNQNKTNEMSARVIQDDKLSAALSATTLFNAIDKTLDRTGEGTAKITFEIMGQQGFPKENLVRENMFYSPVGIGELAVGEFFEVMAILFENQFAEVDILDVKVNVEIEEIRKTARIMEARPLKSEAKPGEKVDIAVKIQPYRGEIIEKIVTYQVPKEIKPGSMLLTVRGGGMVPVFYALFDEGSKGAEAVMFKKPNKKPKSMQELVNTIMAKDRNHDIVVEQFPTALLPQNAKPNNDNNKIKTPLMLMSEEKVTKLKDEVPTNSRQGLQGNKYYIATEYIIEGDTQIVLEVK